jgi:hypothetical protein
MSKRFEATLVGRGPRDAWVFLVVPFDAAAVFGSKARIAVRGTLNGAPFQNSLLPQGDGTHAMAVSKALRAAANANAGDTVAVVMERDDSVRDVDVPEELQVALAGNTRAATTFAALAVSHRRAYTDWIASAKQATTRERRATKAVEMLVEGKTFG